jgi:hypothetical protein
MSDRTYAPHLCKRGHKFKSQSSAFGCKRCRKLDEKERLIDVSKCSGIELSLIRAFEMKKKRGWDRLYIAVDLHDTLVWSSYTKDMNEKIELFPDCIDPLRFMSSHELFVPILFTSSYVDYLAQYYAKFKEEGIEFKYFNENPECPSTQMGDYSKKFYYSILIDDKAGFNPLTDWAKLGTLLPRIFKDDYKLSIPEILSTFMLRAR